MIPVLVTMALGAIEWASAVALYRQFIYEETCQMGTMTAFALMNAGMGVNAMGIGQGMADEGIAPGRQDLYDYGWLIPFAVTALEHFYTCAEYMVAITY